MFADPRLGRVVEESFRNDCGSCREVSLEEFRRRPLWQKLLERVLYFFRRSSESRGAWENARNLRDLCAE